MKNQLTKRFNIKKVQILLVAFVLLSASAAVLGPQIAKAGAPQSAVPSNGTQDQEQNLTESNQSVLDINQPAPKLTHSTELSLIHI